MKSIRATFLDVARVSAAAGLLGTLALAGCGGESKPVDPSVLNGDQTVGPGYKNTGGGLFGTSGLTFGVNKNPHGNSSGSGGAGIGVNAYLWRGALDTLSFMPLSSADPFGGVIITDWYQPPGDAAERYKATAYILGQDLRADGVPHRGADRIEDRGCKEGDRPAHRRRPTAGRQRSSSSEQPA